MKDKVIVITGANGGLGEALTRMLSLKGAIVEGFTKDEVDVTKELEVEAFVQNVLQKHGRIDMWINNAGVWLPPQDITEVDMAKAKHLFDVNVFGTIYGTRSAVHAMKGKAGLIINIISTTAFDGMSGSSGTLYVSSKYALRGLTNVLREQLKLENINVMGIYPGGFKSALFKENVPSNFKQFMTAEYVSERIIANLESTEPKLELIIPRPGQQIPHHLV